jgi:hypothetical protein
VDGFDHSKLFRVWRDRVANATDVRRSARTGSGADRADGLVADQRLARFAAESNDVAAFVSIVAGTAGIS